MSPVNILITGTPGCGKTTMIKALVEVNAKRNFRSINIGQFVKEKGLYTEYDSEFDAYVPDEEPLVEALFPILRDQRPVVIEHHSPLLFEPTEEESKNGRMDGLFTLVVLLRCDESVLFDRLTERGYGVEKVIENHAAEVGNSCGIDAKELVEYGVASHMMELDATHPDTIQSSVETIMKRVEQIEKEE